MTAQNRHIEMLEACGAVVVVDALSSCRRRGSNPDSPCGARDFKSCTTVPHKRQRRHEAAALASPGRKSGVSGKSGKPDGTHSPHVSPTLIVAAIRRARGGRR